MKPSRIIYSVELLPSASSDDRLARSQQSAAAAQLLAGLKGRTESCHATSRSHSRTAIAAALTDTPRTALGIDIEWAGQPRPYDAIAELIAGACPAPLTPAQFYRGWTFHEAYYKAFQQTAGKAAIARAMMEAIDDTPVAIDDGVQMLHRQLAAQFQLCLVWRCAPHRVCTPEFITTAPASPAYGKSARGEDT